MAALAVLTLGMMAACGDDDVDVREGGERATPSGMLADEAVLKEMRSSDSLGRVIYDPPPDLSLASAQQRRPEIFRAAGAPARPASRDTTTRRARQP